MNRIITLCNLQFQHGRKIRNLQNKYSKTSPKPSQKLRIILITLFGIISLALLAFEFELEPQSRLGNIFEVTNSSGSKSLFSLYQLIVSAPILFILWILRDTNRIRELENKRKDTNLSEFLQLQQWASGANSNANSQTLQISALHSLRDFLKGEHGENFKRSSFEIFASLMRTTNSQIIQNLDQNNKNVRAEIISQIKKLDIAYQLNRISSDDWFNLLINHDFPIDSLNLNGIDLGEVYLQNKKFRERLNLRDVSLIGANLEGSTLIGVDLSHALLKGAELKDVDLSCALLIKTNLESANLQGANLKGADLAGANLNDANLMGANLSGANLTDANLQATNLEGANLTDASLANAKLHGANIAHGILLNVSLEDSNLLGANLFFSQLQGSDLQNAILIGADLSNAQAQATFLNGAHLQGANFFSTKLHGASTIDPSAFDDNDKIKERETEVSNLWHEKLSKEELEYYSSVLSELKNEFNSNFIDASLDRILSSTEVHSLEKAIFGTLEKQEAMKWVAKYKANTKSSCSNRFAKETLFTKKSLTSRQVQKL